jgi:hypothetical protein
MKSYEWAVIGSGIAGISIAEILTRQGHSTILIEKNDTLASETTRDFHEWLHIGSLYTLIPDKLITLRFILGAIDDLIEYYSCYERMNLIPTVAGLKINHSENGWFNNNYIHFKYRVKSRKVTFPWLIGIARSIQLIEKIHKHDWLRRRAGEIAPLVEGRKKRIIHLLKELLVTKEKFKEIQTPDLTINSRILLNDMLATAIKDGLDISIKNKINKIEKKMGYKLLTGETLNIKAKNVAMCCAGGIKYFSDVKTKTSYAPISIVSNLPINANSFVELDYFPKNCINLLSKKKGYGQAGGITLSDKTKCDEYLNYVLAEHKKINPNIKELYRYIGVKTEITFKSQPRGYLYHIVNSDEGIWAIIPGKFTLAFSMAPEFYRRIYKKNPTKKFKAISKGTNSQIISNTVWKDIYKKYNK